MILARHLDAYFRWGESALCCPSTNSLSHRSVQDVHLPQPHPLYDPAATAPMREREIVSLYNRDSSNSRIVPNNRSEGKQQSVQVGPGRGLLSTPLMFDRPQPYPSGRPDIIAMMMIIIIIKVIIT